MTELSIDQLKILGADAARALVGPQAEIVTDVRIALDSTDDISCYFSIRIEHWAESGLSPLKLRIELMHLLRDRMQDAGDPRYPYLKSLMLTPEPTGVRA